MAALAAQPAWSQVVWFDSFEPSIDRTVWMDGPWWGPQNTEAPKFEGDDSHIHSGINAARAHQNYRVTYNVQRFLFDPQFDGVYLSCWLFEDNDFTPLGGIWEHTPNGFITLGNAMGDDYYRVGIRGFGDIEVPNPSFKWSWHLFVETKAEGRILLDGSLGRPDVHRRQGWRKYRIEVYPYTGAPGDVRFYVDDMLIWPGQRMPGPFGFGAALDWVVLGADVWTFANFWYDDVEYGLLSTAVPVATIAEAKAQPDGTMVQLNGKVALNPRGHIEPPHTMREDPVWTPREPRGFWFFGFDSVEETDRSAGIRVLTSYPADTGQILNIRGRIETRGGERVLNAFEITPAGTGTVPKPVALSQKSLETGLSTEGMLIRTAGRVLAKGQERRGDWRYFLILDDGSALPGLPGRSPLGLKVYADGYMYDAGFNVDPSKGPTSNWNTFPPLVGSYILVTGVSARNVSTDGASNEAAIWPRRASDLQILF